MDRQEALLRLRRMASDADEIVDHLDHPLLLTPPDALVRWGRNLAACFFVTKGRGIPPAFRDRAILSRLALPRGVRHILLHVDYPSLGDYYSHAEFVDASFDAVLPFDGRLSRILDERLMGAVDPLDEVRRLHNERFSIAWQETLNPTPGRIRELDSDPRETTALLTFRYKGPSRSAGSLTEKGLRVKIDASRGTRAVRDSITSGVQFAARADYLTDTEGQRVAVDILSRRDAGLAIHLNEIEGDLPRSRAFDPQKPLRAAAFAGMITTNRSTRE